MAKELKLWNGRLVGYKHGYIAAYSRADAIRLAEESFGLRSWRGEITDYWHEGSWGDAMIGVTPRRGLFAQTTDNLLVQIVTKGKEVPIERDDPAAWEAHQLLRRKPHTKNDASERRGCTKRSECRRERLVT